MELRSDEGGWICARSGGAMLYRNMEIKAKGEKIANERQESMLEDEVGCMDGVRVGEEVSQALCT